MNARKKTTRRQFLTGEAAADALSNVRFDITASSPSDSSPLGREPQVRLPSNHLLQIGRRAMACEFQILLNAGQHSGGVEAAMEALDKIDALEDQMTVYRDHSELSTINRRAATEACPVERELFDLLGRCISWSQSTGGAFDITAGPLVKLWGFYTRQGRFPSEAEIAEVLTHVGSEHLDCDPIDHTIRFLRPAMELNLGSVGKGHALDCCSQILAAAGVENYMIQGGQSSISAWGARFADSDDAGWQVALRHPLRSERRLATLQLSNQSLGTSGSGQQFFYHRGRRYGHVLDPRTGVPSQGVLSATVIAPHAADADALATTFFVLGIEATREFCASRPELAVVFVVPGARQGTVATETIGLDEPLTLLE